MTGRVVREFRFPPDPAHVRLLRQVAREAVVDMGMSGFADDVALVLDELANNAIEHGASYRTEQSDLWVRLRPDGGNLSVEFEDREMPPDVVRELEDALSQASGIPPLDSERGRGLFLIAIHFSRLDVGAGPNGGFLLQGVLEARSA